MDLKIILLMSFILTVSSGNDEKQLTDSFSENSKENIQQHNLKDSTTGINNIEQQNITESFKQTNETIEQKITKVSVENDNSESKEQTNDIDTANNGTVEPENLGNSGDGQNIESEGQSKLINASSEQNNENEKQLEPEDMSNKKHNENKEKAKPNDKQNNENKQQIKLTKASFEQNNEQAKQLEQGDMSNEKYNENKEQPKPTNISNEQNNENKEQLKPNDKPNEQIVENKEQQLMNASYEKNNEKQKQTKPKNMSDDQNYENKEQPNPKNMPNEQESVNKEQIKLIDQLIEPNIENKERIKPMNISSEQNNGNKEQSKPSDDNNEQNNEQQKLINNSSEPSTETKGELTRKEVNNSESNREPPKIKDFIQNYDIVEKLNTEESLADQNNENADNKNPTSTSKGHNDENKNDSVNDKSYENIVTQLSPQPQEVKSQNDTNIEKHILENSFSGPRHDNISSPINFKDSVNGQQNDNKEQQNSKDSLKSLIVEQKDLTDLITGQSNKMTEQINSTKLFGELNNESFNTLKPNKATEKQNYEDLDKQESSVSFNKQIYKDIGEESKNESFKRQNSTVLGKPNIVIIMADDMGWNDFSYHGSDQILTPNIDVIAYQGVVLQQHYTDAYGTPSRSAFFTGKYPFRLGTQSESILASEDRGLSVYERLLPSYLKELGYITHLVGKWGLGKSREHFLPTNRGFDTFFGFLDSAVDYYTYDHVESWNNTQYFGLDLYNNRIPAEHINGHLTEVLTEHAVQLIKEHPVSYPMYLQVSHAAPHAGGGMVNLQPPEDEIAKNDHIAHTARRLYAGLVTGLDDSVGQIISALAEKQILNNTIIVFLTDNGAPTVGPTQNYGSNLPLRGVKGTPWEGGVRSSAIMWHHNVETNIWGGLFHITDWLPTLVSAAGGNITEAIDGVNQWQPINNNGPSKRNDVLITVDDLNGWAAMIEGDYKIIIGNACTNEFSGYSGKNLTGFKHEPPYYGNILLDCEAARVMKDLDRELDLQSALLKRNDTVLNEIGKVDLRELCVPTEAKGCLFNIKEDPLEAHDLWATLPDLIKHLTLRLRTMWAELKPRSKPARDDRCNPARSNFVWTQWLENDEPHPATLLFPAPFPLQASKDELQYLVDINMNSFKDKIYEYVQGMGDSFVKSVSGLFNF